jgi:hypothetical protein
VGRILALLIVVMIVAGACGGDDAASQEPAAQATSTVSEPSPMVVPDATLAPDVTQEPTAIAVPAPDAGDSGGDGSALGVLSLTAAQFGGLSLAPESVAVLMGAVVVEHPAATLIHLRLVATFP